MFIELFSDLLHFAEQVLLLLAVEHSRASARFEHVIGLGGGRSLHLVELLLQNSPFLII